MKRILVFLAGLICTVMLLGYEQPIPDFIVPTPTPEEKPEAPENPGTPETPAPAPAGGRVIVGYVTYWESRLPDPTFLTHINYAFALIKNDFETLDIKTPSRLQQVVALKKQNPDLKVMLSVGGWGAGNFSEMAGDANHRRKFAENCLAAVNKYGLDGIDIDWEYPTSSSAGITSSPLDMNNFTLLMKDLREVLGSNKLLTIATYAGVKYYDLRTCGQYLDFVNIMTYDMGRPPYHHSALYSSSKTKNSCVEAVEKHHSAGVPYDKLVLGVPFYGKPAEGESVDYADIISGSGAYSKYTRRWDDVSKVPYLADASGAMVLCYDDAESLALKAEYIINKGLLGAMYWSVEADDASWTLSKALASPLLGGQNPSQPEDPEDDGLPTYQVTNQYMQDYMDQVTYNVTYTDKTTP